MSEVPGSPDGRDELVVRPVTSFGGTLRVPGDKSISHRVLIIASLAPVPVVLRGLPDGDAVARTRTAMVALGAWIDDLSDGSVRVEGVGAPGIGEPRDVIDCGGSGTTMRLLAGLAATGPGLTVLTGDARLRQRPMARVVDPLRRLGATVLAAHGGTRAPLAVRGGSLSGLVHAPAVPSAQVKSCLLLAGLAARGQVVVREAAPSRDHTERLLRSWGIDLDVQPGLVRMVGGQPLIPPAAEPDLEVPGDLSAAAFVMVAAAMIPGGEVVVPGVGINPTRTGVLEVLEQMGATVQITPQPSRWGEPVGDVLVRAPARLRAFDLGGDRLVRAIDEVPALVVAAAVAEGTSRVRDGGELRHKESDRLAALGTELGRLGVAIDVEPAGLRVLGGTLHGGIVDSHGDHRMAAALVVAGLAAKAAVVVRGASAMAASWPGMVEQLGCLCGPRRS